MSKVVFRKITEEEEALVTTTILSSFGERSLYAFEDSDFWIKEGKVKEVFAVPQSSSNLISETFGSEVYSAGIAVGSIWTNSFQIEIEGAKMISKYTSKKIIVKTDQFLYGKPIFKENILKYNDPFDKNDSIIIFGKNNLFYGIGEAQVSSDELKSLNQNTVVIKGSRTKPFDVGWYLRGGN